MLTGKPLPGLRSEVSVRSMLEISGETMDTRYHYNPATGKVGACRADPSKPNSRGCKFEAMGSDHYSTTEEAAEAYAATQELLPESSSRAIPSVSSSGRVISREQEEFFKSSVARDSNGQLLEVHHGSSKDFDSFDPALIGKGNDAWGGGFYFTTEKWTADSYSGRRDGSREFYLAITNPIRVDGVESMSMMDVELTPEQNRQIILAHPDLQLQPDEMDERSNPLANYSPEFWDRKHHTPEQLRSMANRVYEKYFSGANWVHIEDFYGREYGREFIEAVSNATGHDGVEVDFGPEEGKFFVAWNPEQIKLSSNSNPQAGTQIHS